MASKEEAIKYANEALQRGRERKPPWLKAWRTALNLADALVRVGREWVGLDGDDGRKG